MKSTLSVLLAGAVLAAGAATAGDATLSARKVASDAKDFYGKTVTVKAEVERVMGPSMFTLDGDRVVPGPDLLVMVPKGVTAGVVADQDVVVTGVVRPYVEAELERDFDFFEGGDLVDVDKKVDFDTKPVLVASEVRKIDKK